MYYHASQTPENVPCMKNIIQLPTIRNTAFFKGEVSFFVGNSPSFYFGLIVDDDSLRQIVNGFFEKQCLERFRNVIITAIRCKFRKGV